MQVLFPSRKQAVAILTVLLCQCWSVNTFYLPCSYQDIVYKEELGVLNPGYPGSFRDQFWIGGFHGHTWEPKYHLSKDEHGKLLIIKLNTFWQTNTQNYLFLTPQNSCQSLMARSFCYWDSSNVFGSKQQTWKKGVIQNVLMMPWGITSFLRSFHSTLTLKIMLVRGIIVRNLMLL